VTPATNTELTHRIAELVRDMISDIRPRLIDAALTGDRAEKDNPRHQDNLLTDYDLWMHRRYKELLTEIIPSFIYASEEADPEVIGHDPDPDLCVLVDPLDTSELAVRSLYGYTHILVYSRTLARPVAAVVGDIFHHIQIYLAARDEDGNDHAEMITADRTRHPLDHPSHASLPQALITNYLMRPAQRFQPLAHQHEFLEALGAVSENGKAKGRIGVDFGSIGLCHVAAGFTDAMIEFAKGFAIWDLSPGHYILHAAGGTVTDLHGQPIPLDYSLNTLREINQAMNLRKKFIAAGNSSLASQLQQVLHQD
jgi:myo-inositol-1(or 4)-monophosphatase